MNLQCFVLFAALACLANASPVYYLTTDQTGAQTQIDTTHTSTWSFTPNVDFDFGGAVLAMKAGQKASATVLFNLYSGTDSNGTLLATKTLTNVGFCGQASNCSSYENHPFWFTPVALTSGQSYFASLTSTAPDVQSKAYFIKSDSYFMSGANGTRVEPSPIGPLQSMPVETATPEPGTYGLMIAAAGAFGISRLLRSRNRRMLRA
jgi:hypothetical protein